MQREQFAERWQRVRQWYAPARFGLFYHWGTYTGGGSAEPGKFRAPFAYETMEAFEAAADPDEAAYNMVALAKTVGARYLTWTLLHSCDRYIVKYPTRVPGFRHTEKDYAGALLNRAAMEDLKVLFYVPCSVWDTEWLPKEYCENHAFQVAMKSLLAETITRYSDRLAGIWLDGMPSYDLMLPDYIHSLLPDGIVVQNPNTALSAHSIDYGTTEFLRGEPDPVYCRPSALWKTDRFGAMPPRKDFNEDIPTCNNWWHGSPYETEDQLIQKPYVQDPTFWVKEMVSSLGQRGQWNYALGIGPTIDGTAPAMYRPMIEVMRDFMAWASESIYRTTGGIDALLQPGWWWNGAFGSVTVSLDDPRVHYLHVTTPPGANELVVNAGAGNVREVTNLRTGRRYPFVLRGCLEIGEIDWEDTARYGDTVLRVVFDEV